MEAVIFVGIQGSGKSTFYHQRFRENHVHISLDLLRTREREQALLAACLRAKRPFVIDNTNPSPSDRARYIQPARAAGFRVVAYFFESALKDAIRRNSQRSGKKRVPVPGVAAAFKKLKPPNLDEGFDAIQIVKIDPDGRFVVTELPADAPTGN